MKLPTTAPMIRTALRPASNRVLLYPQTRLINTERDPAPTPGDKTDQGTAKEYNKDGTNPNKNLVYLGIGALGLGGFYAMFMAKPRKVVEKEMGSGRTP